MEHANDTCASKQKINKHREHKVKVHVRFFSPLEYEQHTEIKTNQKSIFTSFAALFYPVQEHNVPS